MVTEQDIIKTANNLLQAKRYLQCCYGLFKPPEEVAEAINEMVELYRLKGLEMLAEYERGKQDEIDYVTFMEERGLG